jgi:hypothetical protein
MRRSILGLFVLCLALRLESASAGAPWVEPLNERVTGIRGQIQNASMKLKNGVGSPGKAQANGAGQSPAEACCNNNVQNMNRLIEDLGMLLVQLDASFVDGQKPEGREAIRNMKGTLVQLIYANDAFHKAKSIPAAEAGLRALTRGYLQLRGHADLLEVCCSQARQGG